MILLTGFSSFLFWTTAVFATAAEINDETNETTSSCGCSSKLSRSTDSLLKVEDHVINGDSIGFSNLREQIISRLNSNMVLIPGGSGVVGTDKPLIPGDGEGPKRPIAVSPFYIDTFEVSNDDYRQFVEDAHFKTESEVFGWSFVFDAAVADHIKANITQAVLGAEWWLPVNGSYWREPEGPGSDVFSAANPRGTHAVVHISWNDAVQFCKWRGARLPTEAEWEYAAKGPEESHSTTSPTLFPWGTRLTPSRQHRANIFQGLFPQRNDAEDGYEFVAPVDAFGPQNGYGLYNMIGNVWEWVDDWFTARHTVRPAGHPDTVNPRGPPHGREKVKKGGSFLCHKSFCYRYRTVARFPSTPDSATYNIGFRCARDADGDSAQGADDDYEDEEDDGSVAVRAVHEDEL